MRQLVLPLKDLDRAILASARVRAECWVYGKAVGFKDLAKAWTTDKQPVTDTTAALKVREDGRHYMKPHELLMVLDASEQAFAVLCTELGYEVPERLHKLDAAEECDRLKTAAAELFGDEVLELLKRKAGLL